MANIFHRGEILIWRGQVEVTYLEPVTPNTTSKVINSNGLITVAYDFELKYPEKTDSRPETP